MKYYYLEPEVAGGMGENTIVDNAVHPPVVTELDYQFSGWLGDELLESFPCYVVTSNLAESLSSKSLTGFALAEVKISKSREFEDLYPNRHLPKFAWFKIIGEAGKDDFGIAKDHRLVISQTAFDIIKSVCKNFSQVSEYVSQPA